MDKFDVIIVGGGITGLATACALQNQGFSIAIIEKNHIASMSDASSHTVNRVCALNGCTEHFFKQLGVWQRLPVQRINAYQQIEVWQKDYNPTLIFTAQELALENLGYIVENMLLQQALYEQVNVSHDIQLFDQAVISNLTINDEHAVLTLNNGNHLLSNIVIGADGANSLVRQHTNIPMSFRDYPHTAVVSTINTSESHANTAYQVFSKESILAFLPLHENNFSSIVWSVPPREALELQAISEAEFLKRLTVAFDHRLGTCQLVGRRELFPLKARYARNFAAPRVALVGDAAHTIHPLAGQGVNLGLMDVSLLAKTLITLKQSGKDIGHYAYLRDYERTRKYEAIKMLSAMQGLKMLFNPPLAGLRWITSQGMILLEHQTWLKNYFIVQANGGMR